MASREYGLVKSFGIDNGELDDFRRNECFVLGYELGQLDELLKLPDAISRPVHAANEQRIRESCRRAGREMVIGWCHDDPSEQWMQLFVNRKDD